MNPKSSKKTSIEIKIKLDGSKINQLKQEKFEDESLNSQPPLNILNSSRRLKQKIYNSWFIFLGLICNSTSCSKKNNPDGDNKSESSESPSSSSSSDGSANKLSGLSVTFWDSDNLKYMELGTNSTWSTEVVVTNKKHGKLVPKIIFFDSGQPAIFYGEQIENNSFYTLKAAVKNTTDKKWQIAEVGGLGSSSKLEGHRKKNGDLFIFGQTTGGISIGSLTKNLQGTFLPTKSSKYYHLGYCSFNFGMILDQNDVMHSARSDDSKRDLNYLTDADNGKFDVVSKSVGTGGVLNKHIPIFKDETKNQLEILGYHQGRKTLLSVTGTFGNWIHKDLLTDNHIGEPYDAVRDTEGSLHIIFQSREDDKGLTYIQIRGDEIKTRYIDKSPIIEISIGSVFDKIVAFQLSPGDKLQTNDLKFIANLKNNGELKPVTTIAQDLDEGGFSWSHPSMK